MEHWNNHRVIKFFLSCVLVLSVIFGITGPCEVIARDYFVAASNGNDTNSGTKETPFLTLNKGVSVLLAGDTLFVRGGRYLGSSSLSKIKSGNSWAEPVTIKAYQKEKVVIAAEPGATVLTFNPGDHHIIFDGFVFDAKGGHGGIRTGEGSHHIRITNGEVMNAPSQGILTQVGSAGASESFEFINLKVHDNGTTDFDHGFYITTNNHLVKDCEIYRNAGWGVHIYGGSTQKPSYNKIFNNKIYDNARVGNRGFGIGIYSGRGNVAINNIVWGNLQTGIHIDFGASDSKVYNNTIYGNKNGILIDKGATSAQVINNISYNNTNVNIKNEGVGTTSSNNLTGNPLFIDAFKRDFRLQPGSDAILSGLILTEVTTDFDYKLRPKNANYDIGAFQGGNLQAPPSALRVLNP